MKRRHFVRAEEDSEDENAGENTKSLKSARSGQDSECEGAQTGVSAHHSDAARCHDNQSDGCGSEYAAEQNIGSQEPHFHGKDTTLTGKSADSSVLGSEIQTAGRSANSESSTESKEDNAKGLSRACEFREESSEESGKDGSGEESSEESSDESTGSAPNKLVFKRTRRTGKNDNGDRQASRHDAAMSLLDQEKNSLKPIQQHEVDDTDNVDPEAELLAWKKRQLARQRRDQAIMRRTEEERESKMLARERRLRNVD